jgi:hypothetical protein
VSIEFDGFDELLADLGAVTRKTAGLAVKAVAVNAGKVKAAWRQADSGIKHAPAYPASITYDVHTGAGYVEAEIGPDKNRNQGALGNILEFGTANNPPRGSGARALAANIADLEHGVDLALREVL